MTLASGTDRMRVCRVFTGIPWASGSCLLVKVPEVFGDGELRALVSRFGEVLVLVGLVERVFEGVALSLTVPPATGK